MSRTIIRIWVYAFPLPAVTGIYFIWAAWSKSWTFATYVILLPLFYGYVAPGIATNVLHKWRFKGRWVVGRFYAHHGFIYAAHLSPALFLSFLGTPQTSLSAGTVVRILFCTASLYAFVAWIHDILMVRHGMVEISNPQATEGSSPEEIVTRYGPVCFFLIGLTYAAAALLAFHTLVIQHKADAVSILWISLVGLVLLFSVPSLAYRTLEHT